MSILLGLNLIQAMAGDLSDILSHLEMGRRNENGGRMQNGKWTEKDNPKD